MTTSEIETYFEGLATRFRPIGHTPAKPRYCQADILELLSNYVGKLDLSQWCLLLEAPTGSLVDNDANGIFDDQEISFIVGRKVPDRDHAARRQTLSEAREMGCEIIARILEEREFTDIDENTVDYDKVGPVYGTANVYGYRFSFTATDARALVSKPENWA